MRALTDLIRQIPERHRWKVYVAAFATLLVVLVALLVVDVIRGGDAGEWLKWVAAVAGVTGTGIAAANTDRRG